MPELRGHRSRATRPLTIDPQVMEMTHLFQHRPGRPPLCTHKALSRAGKLIVRHGYEDGSIAVNRPVGPTVRPVAAVRTFAAEAATRVPSGPPDRRSGSTRPAAPRASRPWR